MKKLLMLIAMTLCLGATGYAQDLRNSSNSFIGKIESDGTVRNSSNSCIGYAKGVKKEWAAIYFFFNFFK
jgi:hypothetical protein